MMPSTKNETNATSSALDADLQTTFSQIREDLLRLARARLDKRLMIRVGASDIVQDVYLSAQQRYEDYLKQPDVPLSAWLRFLTIQAVQEAHRFHVQREKRSMNREHPMSMDASVVNIVAMLADSLTTPHSAALKNELRQAVREFLQTLSDVDQEVLRLRHEELLSNQEVADLMGISDTAASKRYIRALKRLRSLAKEYVP